MKKSYIRAMAQKFGLEPDVLGHEIAFQKFVEFLELKFKKKHAGVCKKIATALIEKSNSCASPYTRAVLRKQANSLKYASRIIEKTPPIKGGQKGK